MCSGNDSKKAKQKAKEAEKKAKQRQAELDALAKQRTLLAAEQQSKKVELESQLAAQQKSQAAQVDELKGQQAERIAGIRAAGGAAATSLRILGQNQPMGPTAQITTTRNSRRGAGTTSALVARGSSASRGTNLSI